MSGLGASSTPRAAAGAPPWGLKVVQDIVDWVEQVRRGPQPETGYAAAAMPDATKFARCRVYVTDTGKPAWSNGTDWKYADGSAV